VEDPSGQDVSCLVNKNGRQLNGGDQDPQFHPELTSATAEPAF
jgi:hypothetical protein